MFKQGLGPRLIPSPPFPINHKDHKFVKPGFPSIGHRGLAKLRPGAGRWCSVCVCVWFLARWPVQQRVQGTPTRNFDTYPKLLQCNLT